MRLAILFTNFILITKKTWLRMKLPYLAWHCDQGSLLVLKPQQQSIHWGVLAYFFCWQLSPWTSAPPLTTSDQQKALEACSTDSEDHTRHPTGREKKINIYVINYINYIINFSLILPIIFHCFTVYLW